MAYGVYIAEKNDFFVSQLTWDGIIAIVAIAVVMAPIIWLQWRRFHPLEAWFSLDPYSWSEHGKRPRDFAPNWEFGSYALLRIQAKTDFNLRNFKVRLVERKWWRRGHLYLWRPPSTDIAHVTEAIDAWYYSAPTPLCYFESDIEPLSGGTTILGEYWNDFDDSRGVDIAEGDFIWLGVKAEGNQPWSGRLEIEIRVKGKRIFERKRVRFTEKPKSGMADFQIGVISKAYPEIGKGCPCC